MADVLLRFRGDASGALRASAQTQAALGGVGRAGANTGAVLRRALLVGGAVVATGLGLAAKAAIDFESSFAGIEKTVEGTPAQLRAIAQGMRDMAKEIPVNVNELNRIGEAAGQLGISRTGILGFTRTIADLGVTTNLVGEEAAASLARIANIVGTSEKDYRRLGSTIVALGNAGASTEAEIVQMGLRIAGAGKQIGLSEAQILGMANALSSVGIEAEAGGTAISRVMIEIAKTVRSGGERLDEFAKIAGVSSAGFRQAFEKDAAGAVVTFIEGLGKLSKAGGNVFKVLDALGSAGRAPRRARPGRAATQVAAPDSPAAQAPWGKAVLAPVESSLVGFFLRVRPGAATRLTDEGGSFEGVEVTDDIQDFEKGRYPKGWTYQGASEEEAARLEATGLFERVDDSFAAVRIRDEARPPLGVDLSNERILGIVEDAPPSTLAAGSTEPERVLHQLAAHLKASGLDEQTFREQLRADPRLAVYADADFPALRFYVGRAEAISLIAIDDAEPIYADESGLASLLGTQD